MIEAAQSLLWPFLESSSHPGSNRSLRSVSVWSIAVLVEWVELVLPDTEYENSFAEIKPFEGMFKENQIILVKLFLQTGRATHRSRLWRRLEGPEKCWK